MGSPVLFCKSRAGVSARGFQVRKKKSKLCLERENDAMSGPRDEGLWDETITSYVTACIPGLRILASCGQQSTPSAPT